MTEEQKAQEEQLKKFRDDYEKVCAKHGLQLMFVPQWKQSMDTGTYSLVIATTVMEYKPIKKDP